MGRLDSHGGRYSSEISNLVRREPDGLAALVLLIERCVSNAKRPLLWYRRRHEAEGDGGGVGAAAATGDGVAGERTLARDRRAHGGGGVQRRLAVAGGGASAWCGGVGAETRPGSAAEIDGAATRALAAAARPRGARPRVRDRSLDDQAGSDGDHALVRCSLSPGA